jgi:hypothetical protein
LFVVDAGGGDVGVLERAARGLLQERAMAGREAVLGLLADGAGDGPRAPPPARRRGGESVGSGVSCQKA